MVIREDLEREIQAVTIPAGGQSERPEAMMGGGEGGEAGFLQSTGLQKCPYLAGRPPCGTFHLFPSGTNVCWADPSEEKPYRAISRSTQDAHCFAGPEGQRSCPRYQQAEAQSLPLPQFEPPRPAALAPEWALPRTTVLRRRGRGRRRKDERSARLWANVSWLVPLGLALLLVLMLR